MSNRVDGYWPDSGCTSACEVEFQPWDLNIRSVSNGFILFGKHPETGYPYEEVIEEKEDDLLAANERVLWAVMEYFAMDGTKHDPERLRVVRKKKGK